MSSVTRNIAPEYFCCGRANYAEFKERFTLAMQAQGLDKILTSDQTAPLHELTQDTVETTRDTAGNIIGTITTQKAVLSTILSRSLLRTNSLQFASPRLTNEPPTRATGGEYKDDVLRTTFIVSINNDEYTNAASTILPDATLEDTIALLRNCWLIRHHRKANEMAAVALATTVTAAAVNAQAQTDRLKFITHTHFDYPRGSVLLTHYRDDISRSRIVNSIWRVEQDHGMDNGYLT
ncbi:hypothetical protein C8J56DRAFT_1064122 [Mycena floridula]|nr:hypothetical protein C8J56DRAFT_1064122 [Mycena floridula]